MSFVLLLLITAVFALNKPCLIPLNLSPSVERWRFVHIPSSTLYSIRIRVRKPVHRTVGT